MATFALTGTVPRAGTDVNVTGTFALTGTIPGDFDSGAVSEITVEYSLLIAGLVDDTWTENRKVTLTTDGGAVFSNVGQVAIGRTNGVYPFTYTESSPASIASWTNPVLAAGNGTWVAYAKTKGNDVTTATVSGATITVTYTPLAGPIAAFATDRQTILTGQAVQFTDNSLNGPTDWLWDFDGGAASSTEQNPLVTFPTAGVYNVTLTASNGAGSSTSPPTAITVQVREAEIWNGAGWVGGESWNGAAWVVPEVYDGVAWIPVKAPV